MKKGYSLIEILVVIGVFAIIGIISTQAVSLSLRATKKNDSIVLVKQELDFVSENIERLLQTANTIIVPGCSNATVATVSVGFRDAGGNRADIACIDMPGNFYTADHDKRVASSSGESISYDKRMTSNNISISGCSLTCVNQGNENYITFIATASATGIQAVEGATVTSSRQIFVRSSYKE